VRSRPSSLFKTIILVGAALLAGCAASFPSDSPVGVHGKLTVKNLKLTDAHGNAVQLRGFSTYNVSGFDWLFTPAFLKELVAAKVDILRVAMYTDPYQSGYFLKDGTPNLKVRQIVETIVKMTRDVGLYCIIDWHTLRDGNPMTHVQEAADFFDAMSKTYGSDPHVLYELANEPNGPDVNWEQACRPYAEKVLAAVRKNAPDALVLVGTPTWDQDVDLAARHPLAPDNNLLYVFHFYAGTHGPELRAKITAAAQTIPLFCTEWGTTASSGIGATFPDETAVWHDFLDQNGFSSCNWSLSTIREGSAALNPDYFPGEGTFIDALTPSGKLALQMIQRPKKP
jgi:endoglucanase